MIFSGLRPTGVGARASPGPYAPPPIELIKPRAPEFSIGFKQTINNNQLGPGPAFFPKLPKKSPEYSFGIRHSECSPPMITECDEKC